jgi:hypothetical protein
MTSRAFLALASLVLVSSCVDDEFIDTEKILLAPCRAVFESEADLLVAITYSKGWTVELNIDSCFSIDRSLGFGNDTITVSLKDKTDRESRSVTLTVSSTVDPELTASILIEKPGVEFRLSREFVNFGENFLETGITIAHSGNWTASLSDGSWCRLDRTSGTGYGEITVTTAFPPDTVIKTSVLTVASVDYPSLVAEIPLAYHPPGHGRLTVLQQATRGAGIDIVILGDGFTVGDFKPGGKWDTILEHSHRTLFLLEPFRTFREYFNLYAVSAVSATGTIGTQTPGKTFFRTYYSGSRYLRIADQQKAYAFAGEYAPVGQGRELAVALILNDTRYGGTAYLDADVGIGISPLNSHYFEYTLIHETLGHAFGKLADEYVEFNLAISDAILKRNQDQKERFGYFQNVEYIDRPESFANTAWRSLYLSSYPGVGIYEGGHTYRFGVWRSSENSIMNGTSGAFNAVSREILVRRIYRLAGLEAQYSLDAFLEYDPINLDPLTRSDATPIALPPAWYPPI